MTRTEGDSQSLLGGADSRTEYFSNRMKMLEAELMKDPRFIRPSILDSNVKEKKQDTVTIQRLNSVLGTTNTVCCIGILVNGEDGHLHIEDETMRIRLNLTKTHSAKDSFFTEGSIVIVEGSNRGGVFWADNIHQPPTIPMPTRNEISEKDHFGAYTYVRNNVLNKIEEIDKLAMNKREDLEDSIDENEGIVIMSNIFLDEPETIHALDRIFTAYESIEAINTFILCGEFISLKKADSLDFEGIKF